MKPPLPASRLRLLPLDAYRGVNSADPLRFYFWPILGSFYRRRVEMCLDRCGGGARVLEVGFGSGLSFLNLAEKYAEIHGVDLTADADEVTAVFRERGLEARLLAGSVLALPYASATFDTVLMISILEHLRPDQQGPAFEEIRRVLRPGGEAVFGVPVERGLMRLIFSGLGVDIREHHFSTDGQVVAAARAGLGDGRIERLGLPGLGAVYVVGHFLKADPPRTPRQEIRLGERS